MPITVSSRSPTSAHGGRPRPACPCHWPRSAHGRTWTPSCALRAQDALRRSVEHAFAHPLDSLAYVRAHSQEMSDEVCRRHIDLYVNEFTVDLGDDGMAAVDALLARAVESPA